MCEILNKLFVTTYSNIHKYIKNTQSEKVYFINCTSELPNIYTNCLNVSIDEDLSKHCLNILYVGLPLLIEDICDLLYEGYSVVLYCSDGSRAAYIACAYIMRVYHFNLNASIEFIQKRIPRIFKSDTGLLKVLKKYEDDLLPPGAPDVKWNTIAYNPIRDDNNLLRKTITQQTNSMKTPILLTEEDLHEQIALMECRIVKTIVKYIDTQLDYLSMSSNIKKDI